MADSCIVQEPLCLYTVLAVACDVQNRLGWCVASHIVRWPFNTVHACFTVKNHCIFMYDYIPKTGINHPQLSWFKLLCRSVHFSQFWDLDPIKSAYGIVGISDHLVYSIVSMRASTLSGLRHLCHTWFLMQNPLLHRKARQKYSIVFPCVAGFSWSFTFRPVEFTIHEPFKVWGQQELEPIAHGCSELFSHSYSTVYCMAVVCCILLF